MSRRDGAGQFFIMVNTTGLSTKTFCTRLYKCAFYEETNDYLNNIRKLFDRVLLSYKKDPSKSILSYFALLFSRRSFRRGEYVYAADRKTFKNLCEVCALNINNFVLKFKPTEFMVKNNYKFLVVGSLHCIIPGYNVTFSYKEPKYIDEDIDIACMNSYIYNTLNNTTNSCLIMSVPSNSYFQIKYDKTDYTMGRGFLAQTERTKIRRRGDHCLRCKNNCRYKFINGSDRLEVLL